MNIRGTRFSPTALKPALQARLQKFVLNKPLDKRRCLLRQILPARKELAGITVDFQHCEQYDIEEFISYASKRRIFRNSIVAASQEAGKKTVLAGWELLTRYWQNMSPDQRLTAAWSKIHATGWDQTVEGFSLTEIISDVVEWSKDHSVSVCVKDIYLLILRTNIKDLSPFSTNHLISLLSASLGQAIPLMPETAPVALPRPPIEEAPPAKTAETAEQAKEVRLAELERPAEIETIENIIIGLNCVIPETSNEALDQYLVMFSKDPGDRESLAEALSLEGTTLPMGIELIVALAKLDREVADRTLKESLRMGHMALDIASEGPITLAAVLKDSPSILLRVKEEALRQTVKQYNLTESASFFASWPRGPNPEDKLKESLRRRMTEITETIKDKIAETLGLESDYEAISSAGNLGHYGSVSLGMRQELRLTQELRLELLPGNFLEIEEGVTIKEIRERIRTLNFLVHHEVGHLIQEQTRIEKPKINIQFAHLNQQEAEHNANEVLIDKLAFEAARRIYVHGDGDIMFDKDMRETIAINSYLTLSRIIIRNLENGVHDLPVETICRLISVLEEMSASSHIDGETSGQLLGLSARFNAWVAVPESEAEIRTLIWQYRRLFAETRLEI